MIIRQKEPVNLETSFDKINSFLTPSDLFYIRSHFAEPQVNAATYELSIDGDVDNPFVLTYDELRSLPAEIRISTLECAGNSRVFLVPQAEGAQWELGAVGNAEWMGVPLTALLRRAQMHNEACEIVFEGADCGIPKEKPTPPGLVSYARSIPVAKAMSGDVLLAYQMNGADLPRDHGFPIRTIVPGHYGMASVKWLTRIHVVREPFQGYWQTSDYGYWDYLDGNPVRRALGGMAVKSEILAPSVYETIPANTQYKVSGIAWSGEADVTEIQVSVDGGASWHGARFLDATQRFAWRRWEFDWLTPAVAGPCTLMSRATDSSGVTQPDQHDERFGPYVINHPLPIEVFVR